MRVHQAQGEGAEEQLDQICSMGLCPLDTAGGGEPPRLAVTLHELREEDQLAVSLAAAGEGEVLCELEARSMP